MVDKYYAGDHRLTLYRVTEELDIFYLEWAKQRWRQDNSLARVVSPVGGEQSIDEIDKSEAVAILTGRFNASLARKLID